MKLMKSTATALFTLAAASFGTAALAEADTYTLDPSHSQVMFNYTHLGLSTTFGMFSGFEGEINFDPAHPEDGSVSVSIPTLEMFTGWEARDAHFQSGDFLGSAEDDLVTFVSTGIEVTGEDTAIITGDLTVNGETAVVALDTKMNFVGAHPAPQMNGVPAVGFTATAQILRSDFGAGAFAPFVSDELDLVISIEATGEADS